MWMHHRRGKKSAANGPRPILALAAAVVTALAAMASSGCDSPPPPPPPMPGNLPYVIEKSDMFVINKGDKQFVTTKGADFSQDWTVISASADPLFAISAYLQVIDTAAYRKVTHQHAGFDPYNPSSQGYSDAAKQYKTIPVAAANKETAELVYGFMTNGPAKKRPRSFRFTGKTVTVTKFTDGGFHVIMPGGPENNPYVILKMEELPPGADGK